MDIKGKFFPVGHGLTYAFKVDSVNVLFDINNKCDLAELEDFYGDRRINYFIISHFDADHSNGISKLYDYGFDIEHVYIPYIGAQREVILYFIFMYNQRSALDESAVDILEEIASHNTRITEVEDSEEILVEIATNSPSPFWKFNIHQSINSPHLVANIIAELNAIGISTKDDVRNKVNTLQADIKDAYKKVIKDLNRTSMFMEHGPVNDKEIKESWYEGFRFFPRLTEKEQGVNMHSLITGDCSLSINRRIIDRYVDNLGYVLVPHHSGIREWDDYICQKIDTTIWVVTIGKIGVRPYGLVVSDIYSNNDILYICDNTKSFEYEFII